MAEPRLRCLGCDRVLDAGELFCLHCGGVPFACSPEGQHRVVVGPIASMDFRRQAAELIADRVPGSDVEQLHKAFARAAVVADGVDPLVGRALVERLKKIPAEAQVLGPDDRPGLFGRLFGPIPLVLYGAGLVAAIVAGPWAVLVGVVAGAAVGVLRSPPALRALTTPPALPPPPPVVTALPRMLPRLDGDLRAEFEEVARGSFALLAAASEQGLPVAAAEVQGMGRAVHEVLQEALDRGEAAAQGDAAARARLSELVASVRAAVERTGPRALPEKAEQKLLSEAEIVHEVSKL